MESTFNIWKRNRELYLEFFENYSLKQLNKTPDGFSNNLIWNIGHVVVVQQSLIYKFSGLEGYTPAELYRQYKPGTKPTGDTSESQVSELKDLLTSLIEKTENDYNDEKFSVFHAHTLSTGFHLASLQDAFNFNNYHEGLHLGFMVNIRKFV